MSQRYSLEDQILKEFPQKIKSLEQRIEGYQADIDQRKRNTEPNEDGFSPMLMPGGTVQDFRQTPSWLPPELTKFGVPLSCGGRTSDFVQIREKKEKFYANFC